MLASQESPKATPIMARMARKESQKAKEKPKEKEKETLLKSMPMPPVMPVAADKKVTPNKHKELGRQQKARKQQPLRPMIPVTNNGHGLMTTVGGHPNGMMDGMPVMYTILAWQYPSLRPCIVLSLRWIRGITST